MAQPTASTQQATVRYADMVARLRSDHVQGTRAMRRAMSRLLNGGRNAHSRGPRARMTQRKANRVGLAPSVAR
jgi:hypothetical protein